MRRLRFCARPTLSEGEFMTEGWARWCLSLQGDGARTYADDEGELCRYDSVPASRVAWIQEASQATMRLYVETGECWKLCRDGEEKREPDCRQGRKR